MLVSIVYKDFVKNERKIYVDILKFQTCQLSLFAGHFSHENSTMEILINFTMAIELLKYEKANKNMRLMNAPLRV